MTLTPFWISCSLYFRLRVILETFNTLHKRRHSFAVVLTIYALHKLLRHCYISFRNRENTTTGSIRVIHTTSLEFVPRDYFSAIRNYQNQPPYAPTSEMNIININGFTITYIIFTKWPCFLSSYRNLFLSLQPRTNWCRTTIILSNTLISNSSHCIVVLTSLPLHYQHQIAQTKGYFQ
jgi:hypothetical protein